MYQSIRRFGRQDRPSVSQAPCRSLEEPFLIRPGLFRVRVRGQGHQGQVLERSSERPGAQIVILVIGYLTDEVLKGRALVRGQVGWSSST